MTCAMLSATLRSAAITAKRAPASRTAVAVSTGSLRLTAMMSAPAAASATAMLWPMPLLAPVTSAVLPVRSNKGATLRMRLPQLADFQHVHVCVVEVLPAHRPDEAVTGGAAAHVNGPGR